jgi:pimeloyl-ACP methyl ester carboxylesterase
MGATIEKVRVNGIELAYEVRGEGHALVLAHFSSGSKEMWEDQLGPFAGRYRVVVYDVRGHGWSSAPPAADPHYTMEALVEDQRALLQHLGIEEAYLGGISMGGAIALQFALRHPQMVRALLLCDTTADIGDTTAPRSGAAEDHALAWMRSKGLGRLSQQTWLEWARPLGITRPDELAKGAQRHIERVQQMSVDGFVGAGYALRDHHVLDRLRELKMPTLILTGEHDFLRAGSEQLRAMLPDARYVLIKGAAHISSFWQPEKFSAAVLNFLADVEAGRAIAGYEER